MREAQVSYAQRISCLPNESGDHPVIEVHTKLPKGQVNSFYMKTVDNDGVPVKLSWDHPPSATISLEEMNEGDLIYFDVQDGSHKGVRWKGREFRQRGYSFDDSANQFK